MKVMELITSIHAYGWSPEELYFQYPHLSMSQIYAHKLRVCVRDLEIIAKTAYAEELSDRIQYLPL